MLLIALFFIVILAVGGCWYVAGRRSARTVSEAAVGAHASRRTWLMIEAVAYVGGILILAGATAAIGQHWHELGRWGHAGVFADATALFLVVGIFARPVRAPSVQRLADVAWFVSAAGATGAIGFAVHQVHWHGADLTTLASGAGVAAYSAALWLARRHALQNVAFFAGLVVTVIGLILAIHEPARPLALSAALWTLGVTWAVLGWLGYVVPQRVSLVIGVIVAVVGLGPSLGQFGWMYAIALATAAAAMAASVRLRNTPLLIVGAIAMLLDLTAVLIRYFGKSLGVPGALAVTGVLIVGLALVAARLMRETRTARPAEPDGTEPSPAMPQSNQPVSVPSLGKPEKRSGA